MSLIDKFIDREKTAKATIASPRDVFYNILKQTSGSAFTRELRFDIFYQIIAFRGVVEGIGTSHLVANTALALADCGLTICVVDTSILNPVQDILLKTDEAVEIEDDGKEHLDWFDMPYTKKSVLHISRLKKNISVLSFKGKKRGILDILSTNDSGTLVDIAFTELHNKFDLILVDSCHELSSVNAAALQQSQQIIQVWNDVPTVVGNMENFITNSIVLSCPLDKMRYVVYSKLVRDAIGSLDDLLKQYRLRLLAKSYLSTEIAMLDVTGRVFYQAESTDADIIDYTNCIIDIACHILNIKTENEPKGTITSQDIMDGKVEGTYHKELKDFNDSFSKAHPELRIDTNPMNADLSAYTDGDGSGNQEVQAQPQTSVPRPVPQQQHNATVGAAMVADMMVSQVNRNAEQRVIQQSQGSTGVSNNGTQTPVRQGVNNVGAQTRPKVAGTSVVGQVRQPQGRQVQEQQSQGQQMQRPQGQQSQSLQIQGQPIQRHPQGVVHTQRQVLNNNSQKYNNDFTSSTTEFTHISGGANDFDDFASMPKDEKMSQTLQGKVVASNDADYKMTMEDVSVEAPKKKIGFFNRK